MIALGKDPRQPLSTHLQCLSGTIDALSLSVWYPDVLSESLHNVTELSHLVPLERSGETIA